MRTRLRVVLTIMPQCDRASQNRECDELVRKIPDEADCIRDECRLAATQLPSPGLGVERGEQLVSHERVRAGQGVHQRALTGVGVANETDREIIATRPDFA